jgi:plasmid stabilization system protein ParE
MNGLFRAIESLNKMPFRCSLAIENDYFEEEIRQLLYGKRGRVYRIIFTIREEEVHILFVRHSAQKPLSPEE